MVAPLTQTTLDCLRVIQEIIHYNYDDDPLNAKQLKQGSMRLMCGYIPGLVVSSKYVFR